MRRALALVALLLALPAAALAHAGLVSSDPADGALLTASPTRVRLVFSEPMEVSLSRVWLVTGDGRTIPLEGAADPTEVRAMVAAVDSLPAGAYLVAWRVLSADGHPVEGSLSFSVAGAPAALVAPEPPLPAHLPVDDATTATWGPGLAGAPLLPSLLRGLGVGALMALAGVLFFLGREDTAARGPRRLAMALAVAAPLLLAGHLAAWLTNASPDHRLTADWTGRALTTGPGRVEALRTGLALLSLWALALARRPRLAAILAFAAVAVSGATGHAMAIHPAWSAPLKALHLAAVSVWMGGLLWLVASAREPSERFASAAARVSSLALGAVLLVTVTGAAEALLFLPSPGEVFRSAYGLTTLAKIAGLGLLVLLGAHHKYRVLPRLAEETVAGGFRGSLRTELVLMFAVVLLGGLLAYLPPSDEPTREPPTALSDR